MLPQRPYNFYPGPSTLPLQVLEQAREEFLDYQGLGMSIIEMSHRSPAVEAVNNEAQALLRRLMGIPDNYKVLFLQGGASGQFAMAPMNLLAQGRTADYLLTGVFATKAHEEAASIGSTHVAATTAEGQFRRIPSEREITLSADPVYVHLTSNNTIYGTQWRTFPTIEGTPVVVDMSSDILSRPVDVTKFGLIYAGAQKNLGPAGVTIVIIRDDVPHSPSHIPAIFRYETYIKSNSLYNTPPVFAIYMMKLVLQWIEQQGGAEAMEVLNEKKAGLIYDAIDRSNGFYRGHAEESARSRMNITFRLPSEQLEKQCAKEAEAHGLIGLKGHRTVGGMRLSNYNAMTLDGCRAAQDFLADFATRNG